MNRPAKSRESSTAPALTIERDQLAMLLRVEIYSVERLPLSNTGGHSQTYLCRSDAGDLILRVCTGLQGWYTHYFADRLNLGNWMDSAWAVTSAREKGVPAPVIVYSDRVRRWVIMKRLPGLAINPEYETWRRCPYDEREFGLILGTLHSIAPRGWGPIDDYGNSLFGTWTEFLVAAAESAIETSANRGALPVPLAARLTKQWVPRLRALEPRVPSLLHLESLGFANILYDPDTRKITGLLDFEDCIGGDPLFERAWMEFYFEHDGKDQTHFDFARFEAGYGPIVRDDARTLLYRPFPYLDKLRWIDPQGARTQLYCRKLEELA